MKPQINYHLYLVTDEVERCRYGLVETVKRAVEGGVTLVQYRSEKLNHEEQKAQVLPLQAYLRSVGVPLIINDNVQLAVEIDAEGIHIGQNDMPVAEARALIGPDKILGLTVTTAEQMSKVDTTMVDNIGCGPVFPTITKDDAPPPMGVEGWAKLARLSPLPIVAIGGLNQERTAAIRATGLAAGVAVVSAICAAEDPTQAAKDLL
ncbi:MAG: thiamine phosphate synthase [Akkermansiaceae bacterium]|nr:thiamine phosphate synthase [Akkermansiaceae bacterium]